MMRKSLILINLIVLVVFQVSAQDFENYQRLRASGDIPASFLSPSSEKYQKIVAGKKVPDNLKKFYLENNFELDQLLRSGIILFNDAISQYVSSIADEILKNQPEIRKKFSFYTIKSTSVNAFTTGRGEIFVNTGLLAHLNNEAELALVLCHEMQHYLLRHNLNSYVEYNKIEEGEGVYKRQKQYEKIVSKHSFARELEKSADERGLDLFLTTNYQLSSVDDVFKILSLAHAPYKNEVFDFSILNTGPIKVEANLKSVEIEAIEPLDEDDEEEGTHPSISKRRAEAKEKVKGKSEEGRSAFIVSEAKFKQVQKIARHEMCYILVHQRNYLTALYHSFLLQKQYGVTFFTKKIIAQSLYGLAQYRNNSTYSRLHTDPTDIQGEMKAVFSFFQSLDPKDLATLAARYNYDLHKAYPSDIGLGLMAKDMVEDVIIYTVGEMKNEDSFFLKEIPTTLKSAYEFARIAFVGLWEDAAFQKMIADGKKYRDKNLSEETSRSPKKKEGVNNLLFINPSYLYIDTRSGKDIEWKKMEKKQKKMQAGILYAGKKLEMTTHVLDMNHLNEEKTVEDYNNIVKINEWVDEVLEHEMFMVPSNFNEVLPIAQKYNSTKFVYTGVVDIKRKKPLYTIGNLVFLIYPQAVPFGIYNMVRRKNYSVYFTVVLDFNRHGVFSSEVIPMKGGAKDLMIKNYFYNNMLELKEGSQ